MYVDRPSGLPEVREWSGERLVTKELIFTPFKEYRI
jgi:hypothetical protein